MSTIILASCGNSNNESKNENSDENYEVVTVNANCLYDDTGFLMKMIQ